MRSLLILAHGSRREASNEEIRGLATALAARLDGHYDRCRPAFLELAEPEIVEAIDQEVAAGASEVICFPYFLSAGRHVTEDLPRAIEEGRRRNPEARITLERYLGAQHSLAGMIAQMVS